MTMLETSQTTCTRCGQHPAAPDRKRCDECRAANRATPSARPDALARARDKHRNAHPGISAAYAREAYAEDPDKFKARSSRWRAENPEKWQEVQQQAELRRRTKETGWSPEMYTEAHARQQGRCAICGEVETIKEALAADHDHETGQPRQLLCTRCNLRLSSEHDEELWLEAALAYVRKHKAVS